MEVKFESAIKVAQANADAIYTCLADFRNLSAIIPPDKIKDWTATADTCRFSVDSIGQAGLRIADRDAYKHTVKYMADGNTRFNFYLWVQTKEVAPYDSRVKVTLKAEMNPMMKMMVSGHIQKFVDMLADAIAMHHY